MSCKPRFFRFGLWFLLSSSVAACSADPVEGDPPGDDEPEIDAASSSDAAPSGDAAARALVFDLDPATITIAGGQVPVFQVTDIALTGVTLTGGYHYHVYLDSTDNRYLIYSDDVPTSPDVELDADTAAGSHLVIVDVQDGQHEPIGVRASRPLEVVIMP